MYRRFVLLKWCTCDVLYYSSAAKHQPVIGHYSACDVQDKNTEMWCVKLYALQIILLLLFALLAGFFGLWTSGVIWGGNKPLTLAEHIICHYALCFSLLVIISLCTVSGPWWLKDHVIIIINEYLEAGLAASVSVQHIYYRHELQKELY